MTPALRLLGLCTGVGAALATDAAVVFVVDPAWDCVESYVANVPLLHDYKIIKVMTRLGEPNPCSYQNPEVEISQTITYQSWTPNDEDAAELLCPQLRDMGFPIAAVIPTFDPATYLADRLAACVGARGNPFDGPKAHARFDKWAMSEAVGSAGLRAVKERLVNNWPEAKEYLDSLDPPLSVNNPVVFKILQSSNSQGVFKIYSLEQAENTFKSKIGTKTQYGDTVGEVIIQEFFGGKEYVVDSVSRDGVHKVVAVWYEDLRPGNGYFDLYFGFKLMDPEDEQTKAMIAYANNVLDAVGLQNGASDMEMFWVDAEKQPCVTDMNARWTALMWNDGLGLENALTGHNQITETVNALIDVDAFNALPSVYSITQHGAVLFVLPHHTGTITAVPGSALSAQLPSYFSTFNEGLYPGKVIEKLYNSHPAIFLVLAHEDRAVVEQDYNFIIELENSDKFFNIVPLSTATSLLYSNSNVLGSFSLALVAFAVVAIAARTITRARQHHGEATEYLLVS